MALSKQQMLGMLDGPIAELNGIRAEFARDGAMWTPVFAAWKSAAEVAIEAIFGPTSGALAAFRAIYFSAPPSEGFIDPGDKQIANMIWYGSGLDYALTRLVSYRFVVDRLAVDPPQRSTPYIFISHGGPVRTHVDATRELLSVVGLAPIVVADMPNYGLSVNEKVLGYMRVCVAAVVLATWPFYRSRPRNPPVPSHLAPHPAGIVDGQSEDSLRIGAFFRRTRPHAVAGEPRTDARQTRTGFRRSATRGRPDRRTDLAGPSVAFHLRTAARRNSPAWKYAWPTQ